MKPFHHLYGPVPSRRLGRSLGIDLVPHKICTYDCIYCQIGKTTQKTLVRKEYVPVMEVIEEVERFLKEETSSIDYFSLSGSGEPTLHSKIRSVIEGIKEITSIPIAVITNGSLLYLEEVRQDLLYADVVLPSLDAVSSDAFLKINRPDEGLSAERMVEGLVQFRKIYKGQIWLEILFCRGINDHQDELIRMKEAINRIKPDQIHINTVVRPPSERWAVPLSQKEIEKIKNIFGDKASIISEFDRPPFSLTEGNIKEEILKILRRRPLSLNDLSEGMGIPTEELERHIQPLILKGSIEVRSFGESVFYEVVKEIQISRP
ncbi:MAG: radical SAM protein [Thermodesulfobacteriota bacterium]|nr:radical SAM protein [Thermodesulfobacteriota bacterium]